MKKNIIAGIILCGIIFVIVFSMATSYNKLASSQLKAEEDFAEAYTYLQIRATLLPQLTKIAADYAQTDEDVAIFTALDNSYSTLVKNESITSVVEADNNMTAGIVRLMGLELIYPELMVNEDFIELKSQLLTIEKENTLPKQTFNDSVKKYVRNISAFPNNIIAGICGFDPYPSFADQTSVTTTINTNAAELARVKNELELAEQNDDDEETEDEE